MDLSSWKAQLRKGAAELVVLALIAERESYGLDLLEQIRLAGGLDLSEGSIYPLLTRLHKEGKIRGRWVEVEEAAHPRKYYQLTREGREALSEMLAEWSEFEQGMRQILRKEWSA